jgi:hypothetical protein
MSCGICGVQSGTGACFLRVLRFALRNIPLSVPYSLSSIIICGGYNRPVVDSVPLLPAKIKPNSTCSTPETVALVLSQAVMCKNVSGLSTAGIYLFNWNAFEDSDFTSTA